MISEKGARSDESVLVVIDIQERLFPSIDERYKERIISSVRKLIESAKVLGIPTIHTEQYPKGLGKTIPEISELLENNPIEKTGFSCFSSEEFKDAIADSMARYVIITGIESHICVNQTAFDAMELGYTPIVVEDATGTRNPDNHLTAMEKFRSNGILVESAEMVIYEWLEDAKNRKFKEVLEIIKN
jgi:nicotinamidase-related amidase